MIEDTVAQTGPDPAHFAGSSVAATVKRLFFATRPSFFPASVLPVLVGTAWGYAVAGEFRIMPFVLAVLATVCVHAGANVLNDVGDEIGGSDRDNTDRIYPYTGGSRFIQNGIMTTQQMTIWGITLLVIATLLGLGLIASSGTGVLLFGLVGVSLAVFYSLPRVQLSARGIGEATVALAFGTLPVMGAAWLQSGIVDLNAFLISLPVSMWVAAILLINEVPDIQADALAGKRTLPVRLGARGSRNLYLALHIAAVLSVGIAVARDLLPWPAIAGTGVLMILAIYASSGISLAPDTRERLKKSIEMTLSVHTAGCLWVLGNILYISLQ